MKIKFEELKYELKQILLQNGLNEEQAEICSMTHAQASQDGVTSHGVNRIPRFIEYIRKGWINLKAEMELLNKFSVIETYDGHRGIGIVNAKKASERAIDLAKENGIGIVTLRNTTHWMCGGSYILDMVDQGFMGISWSNTESCMPPWGAKEQSIGNNPICMGIPRKNNPILLDMAESQFSWGKIQTTRMNKEQLPFPGGFNTIGEITKDPSEIEESRRIMPMGYWKGSGFAILLDLFSSILSNGNTTAMIDKINQGSGTGSSQVFIAFDPRYFITEMQMEKIIEETIYNIKNSEST